VTPATHWVDTVGPDGLAARVAVHHLADSPGAPPLLVSHATGLHGHCYRAMATELAGHFDVWAIDHRGHGASPVPAGWIVDWRGYGADTLAVAEWLGARANAPLTGFGHSMGGATLLMAARAAPDLFVELVLFEPIAYPADAFGADPEEFPLVAGARRRRARFESVEAAYANYSSKPPMAWLRPDVLRDYVDYGLRPADPPPGVELRCAPAHEAATFAASASNGVWDELPEIAVPVTVLGSGDADGPALVAPRVAERIPGARFVLLAEQTHFGPLSHPAEVAGLVAPQP
jgi:pimeloyl-ACP methyl ester carboxylesterase